MAESIQPVRLRWRQGEVFQDQNRFIVAVCGRRWSKTTTFLHKLISKAEDKSGLYGYFAPTYKQAKIIAWELLKRLVPRHYRIGPPNETELSIKLANGSIIRLFGLDKPDFLLGIKLSGAMIDEFDKVKDGVYDNLIRPALSDSEGFCWFIGTPDSRRRKLRELYNDVTIKRPVGWSAYHYRTVDGGYVSEDEILKARSEMDEKTFKENFEASFEDVDGQVYYSFSAQNIVDRKYNPNLPLHLCWDFNVDPFCVAVCQRVDIVTRERSVYSDVYAIDELVMSNSNTPEMCRVILEKYKNHNTGMFVYGDATGKARKTASSLSDYQIIMDHFKNVNHFSMRVKNSNPMVKDRVNAVNSMLKAADGKRHLFIDRKLKHLLRDFISVIYKPGTVEVDKSDLKLTHISDALGYFIETEFPVLKAFAR